MIIVPISGGRTIWPGIYGYGLVRDQDKHMADLEPGRKISMMMAARYFEKLLISGFGIWFFLLISPACAIGAI